MKNLLTLQSPKAYKSKFYNHILERELVKKEMDEAKEELKSLLIEKKVNYAKYVRDVHLPTVSFRKQKEMENIKDHLKHPVRTAVKVSPNQPIFSYTPKNFINNS